MTEKSAEKRRDGMKNIITAFALVLFSLLFVCSAQGAPGKGEYLEAKPLSKVVTPRLKPVEAGTKLVYVITWGGDVSLVYGMTSPSRCRRCSTARPRICAARWG
jgi:hypothetical protein